MIIIIIIIIIIVITIIIKSTLYSKIKCMYQKSHTLNNCTKITGSVSQIYHQTEKSKNEEIESGTPPFGG